MPYIGAKQLKASDLKRFSVTGSTSATHALSWTAPNEQSLIITINGVKQHDSAYTISGSPTTITLSSALVSSDEMEVIGINDIGTTITPAQNSVDTDKIADNAVTTAKIADDQITTAKIADDQITTAKIADDQITTAKIADDQITTAKLANAINITSGNSLTIDSGATLSGAGAITVPSGGSLTIDSGATITNNGTNGGGFGKLVQIVSADHYTPGSTSSTSFVNTGLSLAITPTSASNKVLVLVSGMGEAGSGCTIAFRAYRGAAAIGMTSGPSSNGAGSSRCAISISHLDSPATTGTVTYHVKFRKVSGASNAVWNPGSEGGSITLMEVVA